MNDYRLCHLCMQPMRRVGLKVYCLEHGAPPVARAKIFFIDFEEDDSHLNVFVLTSPQEDLAVYA